jgi:phage terminase large subunit-like protein
VFVAKGGKIDHLDVWRFITGELAADHPIQWIAYDPRFFELPARFAEEQGFLMVEFPQSPERMSPACGHALDEIVNGRVLHDGDPTLAAHVNGAQRREGERGFTLSKSKSRGHIDAAVALVMLLWTLAEPPPVEVTEPSVYEDRGLVTL